MGSIIDKFLELWRESTVTSSVLAVGVLSLVAYCVVQSVAIPDAVGNGFLVVITFFFYDKAREQENKRYTARSLAEHKEVSDG